MAAVDTSPIQSIYLTSLLHVIVGAFLLCAFGLYLTTTLHHDISWYLIATDRILEGARPYRDVIEVNPPLAFYLMMPPVATARLSGLPAEACFITYVFVLIALSLYLVDRILTAAAWHTVDRAIMLAAAFVGLVILPISSFGQREHLMLILALPYVFTVSVRFGEVDLPLALSVLVGALAALGFGLKPYFLLAPICVEIHTAIVRRSVLAWARPEVLSLGAGIAIYGAVVLVMHPEYTQVVAPIGALVYFSYDAPLGLVLSKPWAVAMAPALILVLSARVVGLADPRIDTFAIAFVSFLASYVIQQKGWQYHVVPSAGMALLVATAFLVPHHHQTGPVSTCRRAVVSLLAVMSIVTLLFSAISTGPYRNGLAEVLLPEVKRFASKGTIYAFTSHVFVGFPLVNEGQVKWASRFPTQWLLPGALRRLEDPAIIGTEMERRLRQVERYAVNAVIEDLERTPPDLVIVDQKNPYFGELNFSFLEYFRREARFVEFWRPYVKVKDVTIEVHGKRRTFELWCRRKNANRCAS